MRYPEFLKKNGRIGFIAPSFGCDTEPYISCFEKACKRFASMGYAAVEGPNCRLGQGLGKSNTPQACGAEINDFFLNDRCDVIISCGGGETMCEDLPYVDFAGIAKAEPKWFMGYSDNTNLTFTLPLLCDTAAVYGPCVSSFAMEPLHPALYDALKVLTGESLRACNYPVWEKDSLKSAETPFAPYNCTESFCLRVAEKGGKPENAKLAGSLNFSGRLLGGCLDCLENLCGTGFDKVAEFNRRYENDGIIWFLESCDLNPMDVRRAMWHLENAGWFDAAKGFIFGRPYRYGEESFGMNFDEAVISVTERLGLPVLFDTDLGHLPPMMPLICGAMADVTAEDGRLFIDQRLV